MVWWVWGRRTPVSAVVVVLLLWFGSWRTRGYVALLVLVAGVAVLLAGRDLVERAVERERLHVARCRIRWSWRSTVRGAKLVKRDAWPRIRGRVKGSDGVITLKVEPAPGDHVGSWEAAAPGLQQAWRMADVEVRRHVSRSGRATGKLDVVAVTDSAFNRTIDWPFGAPVKPHWCRANLPIGVYAGRRQVLLDLTSAPHVLIGGPPNAGKSTLLHTMLAGLALLPDEALILCDFKGVDLEPWRARAEAVIHTPAEAAPLIKSTLALMESRYRTLGTRGENVWRPNLHGPHVTVAVDEFGELPSSMHAPLERLARLGRAAGISLVIATQRPVSQLGEGFTTLRAMLTNRIALEPVGRGRLVVSVAQREVQMILGESVTVAPSPDANKLFRVYWTDPVVSEIVARTSEQRPTLPALAG